MTPPTPFPLDPVPPAPPQGPTLNLTPPPTWPTVTIWPLGFLRDQPLVEKKIQPLVEKINSTSGIEQTKAIRALMEYL
jgi:hypothetical protein